MSGSGNTVDTVCNADLSSALSPTSAFLCLFQGILFDAMRKAKLIAPGVTWQQVKYSHCGRTDKGVSAAGQVTFQACSSVHDAIA